MNMGWGISKLDNPQTAEKIKKLIKDLDTECDEVLRNDMRPVEVALMVMLHRKHTDTIAYNASEIRWTWRKGSLKSDYNERLQKLKMEGKLAEKGSLDSENYINKVKQELIKVDSNVFPDDNNESENESSNNESEEKLTRYFNEQNIKLAKLNKARIQEIIAEYEHDNSSDAVADITIRDNLLKKLDELNTRYKEDMLRHLKTQTERMTDILNKYHEDQLEMVKKMDEERVNENEKRTCPLSSELLDKLKADGDPDLDLNSQRLIDDMTNNVRKKTANSDELRKLFTDHCGRELQLRVSVQLPHREEVHNEDEPQQYRDAVFRWLHDV
ncbi:uncharacterized protein LOC125671023 isoform X2 [Ostrea edulis]|uniref:uncharacterized protein LOC125671023 isoform X2 n=1 Tax=Ostrea edulis TaxID=37623 RepID=UPI002094FC00|nr:uncharacterized protein LOC125671023 isoform X2 [Ostrea edulis]